MSLVYITFHNENIFDVEKRFKGQRTFAHKYISKFRDNVKKQKEKIDIVELKDGKKLVTSSKKSKNKTMGFAETPLNPPCEFLRKHQGIQWQREREHTCPKLINKVPPVPRVADMPKRASFKDKNPHKCVQNKYFRNHKHRDNFIVLNIKSMKNAKTKKPTPRYIDTPTGDAHLLKKSGLIPQYTCSTNFGKVPCYLQSHKRLLQKFRERCIEQDAVKGQREKGLAGMTMGARELSIQERQDILEGLHANFTELMKVYQSLSLYTDTNAKKTRKGKLEMELRQLEQDMALMESNQAIFVSDY